MTDQTDIVRELKAIGKSLDNLPAKMVSAFGLMVLLLAALVLLACWVKASPKPSPPPPPLETQFDGPDRICLGRQGLGWGPWSETLEGEKR